MKDQKHKDRTRGITVSAMVNTKRYGRKTYVGGELLD